ncbi:MAG: hypothetical protein J6Z79_04600 [Clostridia bacterium]|nr:hypothetical protein [Clostridia bacterium]
MKVKITGWLVFAITALAVAVLCLLGLFAPALWVGGAGSMLALATALFRHGKQSLKETARQAADELDRSPENEKE